MYIIRAATRLYESCLRSSSIYVNPIARGRLCPVPEPLQQLLSHGVQVPPRHCGRMIRWLGVCTASRLSLADVMPDMSLIFSFFRKTSSPAATSMAFERASTLVCGIAPVGSGCTQHPPHHSNTLQHDPLPGPNANGYFTQVAKYTPQQFYEAQVQPRGAVEHGLHPSMMRYWLA